MLIKRLLTAMAVLIVFSACKSVRPDLPTEPQTAIGILQSAGVSRARRGTHVLMQRGEILYYVESRTVDLQLFDAREVRVRGTLEENTDPQSPPVLVADDVQLAGGADVLLWDLPVIGVRFAAPTSWRGVLDGASIQFTMTGSQVVLLTIYRDAGEPLLPQSQPLSLQGLRATRSVDEQAGSQTVSISQGDQFIIFLFTPRDLPLESADAARRSFLRLLRSVDVFPTHAASSSASPAHGLSSSSRGPETIGGQPCGGAAGILCPPGSYCVITDTQVHTGICRT